ncbi:MAG: hypothetical protein HY707_07930 [Ignavibacteriae bacterium]|nr:hypothetical protein [Ignavibacteriota bacterium]
MVHSVRRVYAVPFGACQQIDFLHAKRYGTSTTDSELSSNIAYQKSKCRGFAVVSRTT